MLYLWVKAFHIIAVIAWIASLLLYPRYKIHQLSGEMGSDVFNAMRDASARLKKTIMTPMLVAVWALGLTLLFLNPGLLGEPWMILKLCLVVALSGFHGMFSAIGKKIDTGSLPLSTGRLRMLNEGPFLLLIGIVILVVVKPF